MQEEYPITIKLKPRLMLTKNIVSDLNLNYLMLIKTTSLKTLFVLTTYLTEKFKSSNRHLVLYLDPLHPLLHPDTTPLCDLFPPLH